MPPLTKMDERLFFVDDCRFLDIADILLEEIGS